MGAISFLSGLLNGGDLVKSVGDAIHENFTTDKERMALQNEAAKAEQAFRLEEDKLDAQEVLGQQSINLKEAENPHLFVAGWRPAVGWICAIGLFYAVLLYPVFCWMNGILNVMISKVIPNPPQIDISVLMTILPGMLGMAIIRSRDKEKGNATTGIRVGGK